jgi:hypothetical protein
MAQYRKRPVVIEAVQFHNEGDHPAVTLAWKFLDTGEITDRAVPFLPVSRAVFAIKTLEGWHEVTSGDWIITGIKGEVYPCKPDIFAATYEPVL